MMALLILEYGYLQRRFSRQFSSFSAPIQEPRNSEIFQAAAHKALTALRQSNWQAFEQQTASHLLIQSYMRVYVMNSDWSPQQLKNLFPPVLFSGKYSKIAADPQGNGVNTGGDLSALEFTIIDTHKPLQPEDKWVFDQFCDLVKETFTMPPDWIEEGQDLLGEDDQPLTGPGVQGKYCSNTFWRVEMDYIGNRWVVTRLIVTGH